MSETYTEAAARTFNDVLVESEGRPESVTTSEGVVVTTGAKLKGNGHLVTTEYSQTPSVVRFAVKPEGRPSYELSVITDGLTEEALRGYAESAHEWVLGVTQTAAT